MPAGLDLWHEKKLTQNVYLGLPNSVETNFISWIKFKEKCSEPTIIKNKYNT